MGQNRRALFLLLAAVRARLKLPEGQPIPAAAVASEDLLGALAGLRENGRSNGTLSGYASSFRLFFDDLAARNLLLRNPAERLPSFAEDRLPRYVPSFTEMRRLLEAPDTRTDHGTRDRAILELLYGSGLRRAELVTLDVADVDLAGGTAFIRDGKGKKDRVVPLTAQAVTWIRNYLAHRPPHRSRRLFLDAKGQRPLTPDIFGYEMRKLFDSAGVDERLTLHSIRHACALHLLEGGADLISIKQLLGHASVQTTAVYLKLTTAHLRRELERAHPREREAARDAAGSPAPEHDEDDSGL